jgi:hypothetical protein
MNQSQEEETVSPIIFCCHNKILATNQFVKNKSLFGSSSQGWKGQEHGASIWQGPSGCIVTWYMMRQSSMLAQVSLPLLIKPLMPSGGPNPP